MLIERGVEAPPLAHFSPPHSWLHPRHPHATAVCPTRKSMCRPVPLTICLCAPPPPQLGWEEVALSGGVEWGWESCMKKTLNRKLSDNEVYNTNSSILLLKKSMLCSKIRCQKVLGFIAFSYKIRGGAPSVSRASSGLHHARALWLPFDEIFDFQSKKNLVMKFTT